MSLNKIRCSALAATVFVTGLAAGCASTTQGAKPHEMSVAGHEAMASAEGDASRAHQGDFDPSAAQDVDRCRRGRNEAGAICWQSVRNPTERHRTEADRHARMAAEHRAAAQALRDAEAQACADIAPADRNESPFLHGEDIAGVELDPGKPGSPARVLVTFRAVDGLSAERLQHLVDCHLARNAALGHVVPEMDACPIVPKSVTAGVSAAPDGRARRDAHDQRSGERRRIAPARAVARESLKRNRGTRRGRT